MQPSERWYPERHYCPLSHKTSHHTAAGFPCAEVRERTSFWLFEFWAAWYMSSFVLAVLDLIKAISAVFCYWKHSHSILVRFARTILYFFFGSAMLALPAGSRLLSSNHTLLYVVGFVGLTSFSPTDVSTEILCSDSPLTKNEKLHRMSVDRLSSPNWILQYVSSGVFPLCFFLDKNFFGKHIDGEWTKAPLYRFSLTIKLYHIISQPLTWTM